MRRPASGGAGLPYARRRIEAYYQMEQLQAVRSGDDASAPDHRT